MMQVPGRARGRDAAGLTRRDCSVGADPSLGCEGGERMRQIEVRVWIDRRVDEVYCLRRRLRPLAGVAQ